jgi:flagellar P-ring protein precursor FlgI
VNVAAIVALLVSLCGFVPTPAHADKIRDLVQVAGVRSNQLVGYGLVVGLDGTGDQTTQAPFTTQSLENMLKQFGVSLPATGTAPQLKDVAAVTITAESSAFAKPGQAIDVTVASIGNAKSIARWRIVDDATSRCRRQRLRRGAG